MLLRKFNSRLFTKPLTKYLHRCYSINDNAASNIPAVTKQIDSYSNIEIQSSKYDLIIKPYDLLDCQDANLLRFSVKSQNAVELSARSKIELAIDRAIKVDDKNVLINTKILALDPAIEPLSYLIEIPIRANLKIDSEQSVCIESIYSDNISIHTTGQNSDIKSKNLQAVELNLEADNGSIFCDGTTLAHQTAIRVKNDNNIHIKKAQGDFLTATCESGTISTDSCYAEQSSFTTKNGSLRLSNVHKSAEISSLENGDIDVTGVHGTLKAKSKGGNIKYQLTEIYGDSEIDADEPNNFQVNISEFVEEHTCISVAAKEITFDNSLAHLETGVKKDRETVFRHGDPDLLEDSLTIKSTGSLTLGKLSWMDTIKAKMGVKAETIT